MHLRKLRLLSILACLVLVLVACADDEVAEDPADPADPADEEEPPEEGEELVLDGELVADAELMEAARAEDPMVLYAALSEVVEIELTEQFTQDTGLDVELVRITSGRMIERVLSEHGADQLAADAIRIPDWTFLDQILDAGIFREHRVPMDEEIPAEFKHEDGRYYSYALGPTGFGYNEALVDPDEVPTTWEGLLDPRWEGEIGLVQAAAGSGPWLIALFTRQEFGLEFWEGLAAQNPRIVGTNGELASELARGEISIAIIRPNVVMFEREDGAPVDYLWPDDGVPVFDFFIGVTEGASSPNAAEVWMNWSMSAAGQSAAAQIAGEYTVHPDSAPPQLFDRELPAMGELTIAQGDPEVWRELRDEWIQEWMEVFDYVP